MDWSTLRLMVIGGTGFFGQHVVRERATWVLRDIRTTSRRIQFVL